MRRIISSLALVLILISFASFVIAENDSSNPQDEEYQRLQNLTRSLPIDPETGEFDVASIEGIRLKSQERIDKINAWLDENVSWLRFVFRMTPAISWLFAVNLYVFLFFFTLLVLNGDEFFFYISNDAGAYVSGLALFAILLVTSIYVNLARLVVKLFDIIFNTLIPYGAIVFMIGIVAYVALIIIFPSAISFIARIPSMIFKGAGARKVVKKGEEEIAKLKQEREIAESYNQGAGI